MKEDEKEIKEKNLEQEISKENTENEALENTTNDKNIEDHENNVEGEEKKETNIDSKKNEINQQESVVEEANTLNEKERNKESEKVDNYVTKKDNTQKKKFIFVIIISIIILLFLSTIFAIININNEKVIKGVYIEGIDVSDLTNEEVLDKLNEKFNEILKRDITLVYENYSTTITPEQIELNFNYDNAVKEAQSIGKTNNILIDNYSILKANIFKTNVNIEINYNKEILLDMIKNIDAELPGAVKQVSYEVNKDKLVITKGQSGISIKTEQLEELIIENIKKQLKDVIDNVQIPVQTTEAEKIDIEKIYKEIYKEPKDAYIEENPFKLHVEEEGLDFKITMEEAKKVINEDKESYEIPLKITKPKVKTSDLGNKIFKQTLAKYTTIYDAGNTSRATNIAIAAKTINGTIILPGETFSYNKVLGNTTKEKGYQLGTAYVAGKVVPAYGGGICQVSTTLYNTVLYANLEIVERYNHSYAVSYVPAGRDATVSYGGKDFKFKNTRTYPMKIVASAKNGVVSISLVGIKEEKEYGIEIKSSVLSTTPYSTTYENNSSLVEGKQRIIQNGHNGCKSKSYKIVKYNGKVISKTLLSSDTYKPMNRIIEKGTKKVKTENKKDTSKGESKKEENQIEEAEVTENED